MASISLPDNQDDREVYLREHRAKSFIKAVYDAQGHSSADTVIMTVRAFDGEPEGLYVALSYAYDSGVSVTMAAPASDKSNGTRFPRS